jgi:hypothetical protein
VFQAAALLLALPLAAVDLPQAAGSAETFYGEVKSGKTFEKRLRSGLVFQLRPNKDRGFTIWLGDGARRKEDYCSVVTPPFHGPSPIDIAGFELISEEVARSRGRPGRRRSFRCVTSREDFIKAQWALRRVLRPPVGQPEVAAAEARRLYELYQRTALEGGLTVNEVKLSNPEGKLPSIESMRFRVRLSRPVVSEEESK